MAHPGRESPVAIEQLLDRLPADPPSRAIATQVRGPLGERQNSCIFYVDSARFPTPAILKICLDPGTGTRRPQDAAAQFKALADADAVMGSGRYRVPKPYLLLETDSILVAEWVDGPCITAAVSRYFVSARALESAIRRAAGWLANFHRAFEVPHGSIDAAQKAQWLETWSTESEFRSGWPANALALLRDSAVNVAGRPLRKSLLHGDFKADNVLLGADTVGIDLQLRHENCTVYDIASFLNHLDAVCYEPFGWRLATLRERLRDVFLQHYIEDAGPIDMKALLWARLYLLASARSSAIPGRFRSIQGLVLDCLLKSCTLELRRL
jgi:hypothetical protein